MESRACFAANIFLTDQHALGKQVVGMSILELFTHPGCVSRREAPGLIRHILKRYPDISFKEVDLHRYHERASLLGIKMSPTLVLDGKIISVGIPRREKFEAFLTDKKRKVRVIQHRRKSQ